MQHLSVMTARVLDQFNEPVYLVGETGRGKTSMCPLYAWARACPPDRRLPLVVNEGDAVAAEICALWPIGKFSCPYLVCS